MAVLQEDLCNTADLWFQNLIQRLFQMHKVFISGGQFLVLIFLMIAAFCTNFWISFACFCLIRTSFSLAVTSYLPLPIDLGGQYAAVLQAIIMSCQSIAYSLGPIIQGYMVPNKTQAEWNQYFLFLSVISVYGVFMFLRYGSGETQAWANSQNQKTELPADVAVSTS